MQLPMLRERLFRDPAGGDTNWGHSVDIDGTTLIAGYTSYVGNNGGVFIMEQKGRSGMLSFSLRPLVETRETSTVMPSLLREISPL